MNAVVVSAQIKVQAMALGLSGAHFIMCCDSFFFSSSPSYE